MEGTPLFWFRLLLVCALAITVGVGVAAWRQRSVPGARPLVVVAFAMSVWIGADLANLFAHSYSMTVFWVKVTWIGVVTVSPAALVMVLEYTGRDHLVTHRSVGALAVVPVVTLALVVTNEHHSLVYRAIEPSTEVAFWVDNTAGPVFWGHVFYGYGLVVAAMILVVGLFAHSEGIYHRQATAMLIGLAAPLLGNVVTVMSLAPINLTSLGFSVSTVALGLAIVRYQLVDVVPVARTTIEDNITDGVFVVDAQDRIRSANPRAKELFGLEGESLAGRDLCAVVPESLIASIGDPSRGVDEDEATIDTPSGTRHVVVDVTPIRDRRDAVVGELVIVRDVTDRWHYERELEAQNEQLERFASLVSHDLRNPLNVAQGYLELARTTDEESAGGSLDEVARSLDRMEDIIEDVLTLTRDGWSIDEREPTDVGALAREAWRHVSTGTATLSVSVDHEVDAAPSQLAQVFENLFRNAVEHGGTSVHVEVGPLESDERSSDDPVGFFVEDDGPGIPESAHESVLEPGYTTDEDGTGLGMHIATNIVDAHDWGLTVTTGRTGGARIEVHYGSPCTTDDTTSIENEKAESGSADLSS